jgi:hypothetical protein
VKLKIYRQTGQPVDVEMQQQYTESYRTMYDRCEAKADKLFQKKSGYLKLLPHMIMLQRYLRFAERELVRKFNGNVEIELPKSPRAWRKLIESYGDTPVMIAREQHTGGIILLLMDDLN